MSVRSSGRESTALVRVHSADCAECRKYLSDLTPSASDFAAWGGAVTVIVPGTLAAATELRAAVHMPFKVVSEARELDLLSGAGVIIADRFGQIFEVSDAGTTHEFSPAREVEEWLKFIGTQCPE